MRSLPKPTSRGFENFFPIVEEAAMALRSAIGSAALATSAAWLFPASAVAQTTAATSAALPPVEGFNRDENKFDFLRHVDAFLKKDLEPRVSPAAQSPQDSGRSATQ
jgi:hypothetical protein